MKAPVQEMRQRVEKPRTIRAMRTHPGPIERGYIPSVVHGTRRHGSISGVSPGGAARVPFPLSVKVAKLQTATDQT